MAGKTYNAGTIFLQVVPVFGDVQNSIRRQARDLNKDLGDEMERGGAEAGKRAGDAMSKELEKSAKTSAKTSSTEFQREYNKAIKGMQDSLEPINLRFQNNDASRQIKEIRAELEELGKKKIRTELDAKEAEAAIRVLSAQLQGLEQDANIAAKLDIKRAVASAETFEKRLDSLHKAAEIELRLETKQAERAMGTFEKKMRESARKAAAHLGDAIDPEAKRIKAELEGLADAEINIDVSDEEARAKLERLTAQARELSLNSVDIQTKVDAGAAEVELSSLLAFVNRLDGRQVDIQVDADVSAAAAKLTLLKRLQQGLFGSDSAESAANSFRSFNAIVLAAVLLIPALVPVLGAAGGALLALIPILGAVGAGLGAMLVGFSGIGPALQALGAQADTAAKDSDTAAKTMRSASYAVADAKLALADAERTAGQAAADAARQVADARRSAAQAIQDALRQQADAQRAYGDAVNEVRDAEQNLRDARKAAAAEMADVKDKIRQNALDIREAQLAAFDTTNAYNGVMADGASTAYDKEAAQVAMLQAREHLHELRDAGVELTKQQKDGKKGTNAVQSAQDALTTALQNQKDAQRALGRAAQAVDQARVEGARRVQDALRAQSRTQADGARNVARAQEALRRSQEAYNQALYDTGDLGSASARNVEAAMSKLGPAGRKFAMFLFGMRDEFYKFRDAIQSAMLPGVERAIKSLIQTYGPQFTNFMARMGGVVGNFFEQLAASLEGPAWRNFFGVMDELGPKMARQFGKTTLNWLEVFANIMTATAPFAERMSKAMLNMSKAVRDWSASKKGSDAVTGFMEYAERIGPKVLDFLGAFIDAAVNLAKALAPWGELILGALTSLLKWIAGMDPKTLGTIVSVLLTMVIAWQAAVGAVALFFGGASAFQTLAGRLVFSIIGIVGILAVLYTHFDSVKTVVDALTGFLWDHKKVISVIAGTILTLVAAYRTYKAIALLVTGVQLALTLGATGLAGATTAQTIAFGENAVAQKASFIWTKVLAAWTGIMTAAQWLLNAAFMGFPLIWIIAAVIAVIAVIILLWKKNETFRRIVTAAWEGLKKVAEIVFKAIGKVINWLWEKAFKPVLNFITAAVKKAWGIIKWAWEHVLKPVFTTIGKFVWAVWKGEFKVVLVLIKAAWKATMIALKWVWEHILKPVFKAIGVFAKELWEKSLKPVFKGISWAWGKLMDGMKWVWEHTLAPVFAWIGEHVLPKLSNAFKSTIGAIKDTWEGLKGVVAKPIKFVIETVMNNGLIAGFNKVAKWVGMKGFDPIPIPGWMQSYATGGVMPGYTPGRDVHQFMSPTGGRLELSGGEAVMRPEWTAAMGPDYVHQMNAIARQGGVRAVQRAMGMGGYWAGGVLPLPGATVKQHTSGYAWPAFDMNWGSGYDDYGMAIKAWKDGIVAQMKYLGDESYGRYVVLNHADNMSSLYAHMSRFGNIKPGQGVRAGSTIGYVGDLGNTGTPPTSHLHFEIRGGHSELDLSQVVDGITGPSLPHVPGWLKDIVLHPLSTVKNWIVNPIKNAAQGLKDSPAFDLVTALPKTVLGGAVDKVMSIIPNWVKHPLGAAKHAFEDHTDYSHYSTGGNSQASALGEAYSHKNGGILPYNGTMMYDAGGYLPPGLTTVVNMTGRPEPVFTSDQFEKMQRESGGGGFTYAPTFEGSDLTPKDVMDDFEFTYRKIHRGGGKYQGVKG